MKKTSRRNFGKQLTGAIASLPILSSTVGALGQGQERRPSGQDQKPRPSAGGQQKIFREHDTPPPMLLMSGSLIIEARTNKNNWGVGSASGSERKHLVTPVDADGMPPPSDIFIAHVKIVDGSGDLLFKFDNDKSSDHRTAIEIWAIMDGTSNEKLRVTHEARDFTLYFPANNRKIDKKANDDPLNPGRQRARYMNGNGSEPHTISSVKVLKGTEQLFYIATDDLASKGQELRIMLWWELQ